MGFTEGSNIVLSETTQMQILFYLNRTIYAKVMATTTTTTTKKRKEEEEEEEMEEKKHNQNKKKKKTRVCAWS